MRIVLIPHVSIDIRAKRVSVCRRGGEFPARVHDSGTKAAPPAFGHVRVREETSGVFNLADEEITFFVSLDRRNAVPCRRCLPVYRSVPPPSSSSRWTRRRGVITCVEEEEAKEENV